MRPFTSKAAILPEQTVGRGLRLMFRNSGTTYQERVDVIGTSKGRGFAGGIKRHHFRRQPKTHGASDRTRAPGSVGQNKYPGRTFKGKRMAGHMGSERVTTENLEVVVVDAEKNLLAVRGSVPGQNGGIVLIKPARPRRRK